MSAIGLAARCFCPALAAGRLLRFNFDRLWLANSLCLANFTPPRRVLRTSGLTRAKTSQQRIAGERLPPSLSPVDFCMAYLAFVFVCLIWGSTFILMERVSHVLGPVDIGIWRLFSAAAALGVIWWIKRDTYHLDRRFIPPILFSALVANVAPYVTQPYVLGTGLWTQLLRRRRGGDAAAHDSGSIPMLGIWPTRRQLARRARRTGVFVFCCR